MNSLSICALHLRKKQSGGEMEISRAIVFMRLPDKYVQLRSAGALPVYIDQLHFSAGRLWTVYVRVLSTDGLMTLDRVTREKVLHP